MKKIAAFFDIDGTLYRDSLMVEHFKKLIKYDIIDPSLWHSHAKKTFLNWDKRQGNYDDYLLELAEIYINSIKGLTKRSIDFTSKQVINLKAERVYRYTRSKIKYHVNNNHIVIFISGSPDFLVRKMAKKYNVTDYIGSNYIFENDIFTGKVIPMWDSESKNKAINNFVKKYDLDLEKSFAYGDTNGDFTMLKRVGNPVAINPAKELLCNIKKDPYLSKNTKIIVERKDVIYNLDPSVSISIENGDL
ncbi:HAD family hydrolase [Tepidibacter formicigenes]|jgi:HAD superfamily hydrolase (TIGR01490 family)|uniref:phosphoserine phosphatase n=1 Tax=Tepidibacter formicigenes DSM 15518 TaxID=1123349 RepID=A0A1M6NES3_9FIRM|nr:HAD-IB family hydrolase [Tepidibacter formicigenes]SHJ94129.1 HAD-superfamily subfamily IB hydrolase, TIGR01490 [Tepidibacter formicigenes DSM 15518]